MEKTKVGAERNEVISQDI